MSLPDDFIVTAEDLAAVRKGQNDGYCLPGFIRGANENGFSYRALLKNGVKVSELKRINDPFVGKVLAAAEARFYSDMG